jgi:probable HAF family extracellular repeat protein
MNMKFEKRVAAHLVILAFALLMFRCGGGARPTASLSANPSSVSQGASSTLTWHTTHATDVSINGLGTVQPNGSQSVTPAASITYTLTATGPGGTQTATATVTVTGAPPPPSPTLGYTITILPLLTGASEASATAINSSGTVVGFSVIQDPSTGSSSFEATMWQGGVASDLGTGVATAINTSGQVAGFTPDNIAWFWSASTGRILIGVLPGLGFDSSLAQGIDDDGTVVGESFLNNTASEQGFKWRMDTGIQPQSNLIEIFAIKNSLMAGRGSNGHASTATNTSQSVLVDLGDLGGSFSVADGVNASGHVCGAADTSTGETHAFFWEQSQGMVDLGTGNTDNGMANAINDSDELVGVIGESPSGMITAKPVARLRSRIAALPLTIDATDRAMVWTQATGILNLNTLVTSPDWTLSAANGINNKGEIVGTAFDQNVLNQAFILEPK